VTGNVLLKLTLVAFGVFKVITLAEPALDATVAAALIESTAVAPDETFTEDTLGHQQSSRGDEATKPTLLTVKFKAPVFLLEELPPIVTVWAVKVSAIETLLITSDLIVIASLKPAKVTVVKVLVPATAVSPAAGVVV
jgi:hypothetical protein